MAATLRIPSQRTASAWVVLTAYVIVCALIVVAPASLPFLGMIGVFTLALVAVFVVLAREAPRPAFVLLAVPLLVVAAVDVLKGCPAVGCATPPGYEPWLNVKFFAKMTLIGPTLGVSSQLPPCAAVCPHRIELVPLVAGYPAVWKGYDG
ncbi:hypothetical protein [Haladaptatus halobius]|uniref:hypothetical protein n=1 Tax=Haladaptatus halobius TaxID=2884875 RepID=UPI001D0BB4F9|nr:hypothetical protein [Haladaptatus halobius]